MPGSLPHSPARIVKELLILEGVGAEPATPPASHPDWSVFHDSEPSSPNSVITVTDTTGTPFRGDSHGGRNEHHGIQIMVRSGTHFGAWTKADAVKVWVDEYKVDGPRIVTIDDTDYCVGLVYRSGSVLRLGPEPNSTRRRFSINALVHVVMQP